MFQIAKLNQTFKVSNQLQYFNHSCFQLFQTNEKEKTVKQWSLKLKTRRSLVTYHCSALGETPRRDRERELKEIESKV